ncbi:hypothetical protein FOE78_03950 [Microlunatus elymi]|uniref:Uncharacterized protein n=1 Tax=Microlunatus elymi TaxID=2596828 RepID=A0A516PVJ2_9ACTN|nr:hypothetical protein [Microlunatus elymi]QDP95180.1 hypothetical protein FOE78_03950 [Microlunatus elymi]
MSLLDHPRVHRLTGAVVAASGDDQRSSVDVDASSGWRTLEQLICVIVLFLLGWRMMVKGGLTVGYIAALLLCPIWIGVARRYRHGTLLFVCAGLTYLSGMALTAFAAQDHRHAAFHDILHDSSLWIGTLAGVGVVLWARTILNLGWIGASFGVGMLLRNITHPDVLAPTNMWKFVYSLPLVVIALAIVSGRRSKIGSVVVLLVLAGISAALDSRSLFGTLLLAAVLVGWQLRPRSGAKPIAWGWTAALVGGLAAAIYNLATALMLDGALGAEVQQRSELQVETAGSLILGGRPELAATLALIRHDPWGFGVGVAPNIFDVMTAKAGMIKINYDPDNGYVERFMFGGHVELHSSAGDLWALFGIPGLAMAVVIVLLAIRGAAQSISAREGNGLLIFLVCYTLWNLPFSPLYSSAPALALTLGLALSIGPPRFSQDLPGRGFNWTNSS